MLFRKNIQPSCTYCQYAAQLDNGMILCAKKGMVAAKEKCLTFRYDPCKRIPGKPKALDLSRYEKEDFTL